MSDPDITFRVGLKEYELDHASMRTRPREPHIERALQTMRGAWTPDDGEPVQYLANFLELEDDVVVVNVKEQHYDPKAIY